MFKRAWIAGIAFGLIFSVWEAKAQPAPEVTTDSPSTEKVRQHTADEINDGVTRFSIPVEIVEDPLEKNALSSAKITPISVSETISLLKSRWRNLLSKL